MDVSTIGGCGAQGMGDGLGALAAFNEPAGLACDGHGHTFVADCGSHRIRKMVRRRALLL